MQEFTLQDPVKKNAYVVACGTAMPAWLRDSLSYDPANSIMQYDRITGGHKDASRAERYEFIGNHRFG